jgi:PDZ domain/Aspartyl protease
MVERSAGNPLYSVRRIARRGWLAGCALAGVAAALLAGPGKPIPAQAAFAGGATAAQVPMELVGSSVIVPVRVNGGQPSGFLLDTGASASAMDRERADRLALAVEQAPPGSSPAGGAPAEAILNARLELPGVRLFLPQLAAIPLVSLGRSLGHQVDGRLGADVLGRFVVEIDYARQTLQLYDPGAFRYAGHGAQFRIRLMNGTPHVEAKIDVPGHGAVKGDFLLDTGSDHALLLSESFAKSRGLLTRRLKTLRPGGLGEGGRGNRLLARLGALELGPYRIAQPIALIQEMQGAGERNYGGIIGSQVLRRFTVILDLPHGRLILEPNPQFREPFETDMSGIAFIAAGARLEDFEVRSVLPDSPAAQAGVRPGDVLVTLDGEPAGSYTLAEIRRLFRQEGHTHKLVFRRGSRQVAVELTPRRLL